MSKIKLAFTIGIFALVVTLLIPTLMTSATSDATQTVELDVGERYDLTERLSVALEDVNSGQNNGTFRVRNEMTLESNTTVINQGNTSSVPLSGENVTITVHDIDSNDVATVSVEYPPTFAYDEGAQTIVDNLPLLLALAGFIMIAGLAVAALKA